MRIAIVGNFGLSYKATMSHRALPIAAELARRGNQVAVFVPDEDPGLEALATSPGVSIQHVGAPRRREGGRSRLLALIGHLAVGLRLVRRALAFRPEVIYAFKPKGYAGLALLVFWLVNRAGRGCVVLALDADDWEGRGGWADREPGPWWERHLITWHEGWCFRHADVVTVASRELAARSARYREQVLYTPNAASPTSPGWQPGNGAARREALGITGKPVVLAYTRFVEFSVQRLLDVFERIVACVPDAQLVVAGKGLNGEEIEVARLARERPFGQQVHVLGWIQPPDLPDVLATADVALYPLDDSLLNRAKCPMKLVDLLLAGVAVVADHVGQAGEYVVDGQTGFLTPPGDPSAMADRAVRLLFDPDLRATFGQAARADILDRWQWSDQVDRIETLLRTAAAGPATPPHRPAARSSGQGESPRSDRPG